MGGIGWDLLAACSISPLKSSTAIYRTAFHVETFQLNLYTINPLNPVWKAVAMPISLF